jgi:uncharacterized metal-binding protein YceD (DUF177 family)
VDTNRDFDIPFKGLSNGSHRYAFEITDAFFESFEYFENESGRLEVIVDLLKEPTMLILHFTINGRVSLSCDRCLAIFEHPVKGDFRLIVKFGETFEEETEDVIVIPHTETRIDVGQFIFEYINLLLPLQRTHADINDCDPEVIGKLESYAKPQTDPRWDALKNIKLKE